MEGDFSIDDMPSVEVSTKNFQQRLSECDAYLSNEQWQQFLYLYKILNKFSNDISGDMPHESAAALYETAKNAREQIIKNLEISTNFDDYRTWLSRLNDVVSDKKKLWKIIHAEISPTIRVTLRHAQEIAAQFFTPSMLFEYGMPSLLSSSLIDFTNIANEEALIDTFYALAGFVRACHLETSFETTNADYIACIQKILNEFTKLADFDAHRFVWLVEAINSNLHISSETFKEICFDAIDEYASREIEHQALQKLHKLCVFSTSPFMRTFPVLKHLINIVYRAYVDERRFFVKKYIFTCFADLNWQSAPTGPSDPIRCWRLFVTNLATKISDRPELPTVTLKHLLDDSLTFFEYYYSGIQPTKEKSADLRADIFVLADVVQQYYQQPVKPETLKRTWYLLFIALVSGTSEEVLNNVTPIVPPIADSPNLGIDHTVHDFNNYQLAAAVLLNIFKEEKDDIPAMVKFIHANY
jgi:hypothetical protein